MTNPSNRPPDKDAILCAELRRAQRADTTTRGRALWQAEQLRLWRLSGPPALHVDYGLALAVVDAVMTMGCYLENDVVGMAVADYEAAQ